MLFIALVVVLQDGHEEHLRLWRALFDPLDHQLILDERLNDEPHELEQFVLVGVVSNAFHVEVT